MSRIPFRSSAVGLSLMMPALCGLGIFWFADRTTDVTWAAVDGEEEFFKIPASHRAYRKALRKTRELNYSDQTAEACLRDLSQSLGIPIQLHESVQKTLQPVKTISFQTKEPVSHQTAIRLVLQEFGLYNQGIAFEENKLTIVGEEGYQGFSLRTYSLKGRSDFSLAARRRWIESTRAEVHPDSWRASDPTWIQPGESIFEIDIYQHQNVHNTIRNRLAQAEGAISLDNDIQTLSFFGFGPSQKTGTDADRKAAVARLRKKYAFESLADRLKYEAGRKQAKAAPLSPQAKERIQSANKQFEADKNSKFSFSHLRSRSLQMLHESEVEAFINRPGAGVSRMPLPGPSYLPKIPPRDLPLASNEMIRTGDDVPVSLPLTKADAAVREISLPSEEALAEFHHHGESAFLSPQSFGYVKNRDQVAGFQSHGFSFAPQLPSHGTHPWYHKEKEVWAIHRLELVSLLKHETPVVYVSRNLPRMDRLQAQPTRSLSSFEQSALKRLDQGEDVITKGSLNRIEMVGSLRATKQCQQCHDVKSGALLGAFTYELLRDPQLDPKKHGNKPAL